VHDSQGGCLIVVVDSAIEGVAIPQKEAVFNDCVRAAAEDCPGPSAIAHKAALLDESRATPVDGNRPGERTG